MFTRRWRLAWALASALAVTHATLGTARAQAPGLPALLPGLYEIDAQTSMPHLEEGLRASGTRERRCLDAAGLGTVFPVLGHPSLANCTLLPATRHDGAAGFWLRCDNPAAASGTARIEVDGERLAGTLDLKMGGKNMTLTQRVQGVRRGDCP